MAFLTKRQIKKYQKKGYDLNLLSRIQPKGNINFKENDSFWKQGDGYHKILHIPHDQYPANGLPRFWMADIMLQRDVISFVALQHASNQELSSQVAQAISNMGVSRNRQDADDFDDNERVKSLAEFRKQLGNNIPSKLMWVDFALAQDTEKELRIEEKELKSRLSQFNVSANDGMQDIEFHNPFIPASRRAMLPTRRKGQAVSIIDLGAGYPFNHTTLMDEHGIYLGQTRTGGAVNFDILYEDDMRNTPTMLIAGRHNTDKQKLLGQYLDAMFAKGHLLFNIDLTGVLVKLTEEQGGRNVTMYGAQEDNYLNIMQVIPTVTKADGLSDNQIESFRDHREKLKAFAQIQDSSLTEKDLNNLGTAINELYTTRGMWGNNAETLDVQGRLHTTDLRPDNYPTLTDLIETLNTCYYDAVNAHEDDKAASYTSLKDTFTSLLDDFGFLNRTSNFEDLSDEDIVNFDLSQIENSALLNIQLYQVLSLITSYAVNNGKKNSKLAQEITEKDQLQHVVITITGAERLFDSGHSKSLEFLVRLINKISSNYAAVIMEMSDLQNILLSSGAIEHDPYVVATRKLFSAFRYRLFAQIDELTIPLLANALQGEMTASELDGLKRLHRGEFFLNIASVQNLVFTQQLISAEDVVAYGSNYRDDNGQSILYDEYSRYSTLN